MSLLIFPIMLALLAAGVMWLRHRHVQDPAKFTIRAALVVTFVMAVLIGLFVIGETFADPGGWHALGLTALWLVPMVALSLLSWLRPRLALPVDALFATAVIGLSLYEATNFDQLRAFENRNGPWLAISVGVIGLPLALLGRRRPLIAGSLLLAVGGIPLVATWVARGAVAVGGSTFAMAAPYLVVGLMLVAAAGLGHHGKSVARIGPS